MKTSIKDLQNANQLLKAENKSFSGAYNDIKKYYQKVNLTISKQLFEAKCSKEIELKLTQFLSEKEQTPTKNNPNGLSKKSLYLQSEKYKKELIEELTQAHPMYEVFTKEGDEAEKEKLGKKIFNEILESHPYKDFVKNRRYQFSPYAVGLLAHAYYNNNKK